MLFKSKLDLYQATFAMGKSIPYLHALWLGDERRAKTVFAAYRHTSNLHPGPQFNYAIIRQAKEVRHTSCVAGHHGK
ncbi:hypothetical protein [Polaromonas sp. UBA4122]|uniref:hypothetical protein n=1 Tax=Polaromonas sp. UBA4122 TaxID=1947074 RepID=UPI0039C8D501